MTASPPQSGGTGSGEKIVIPLEEVGSVSPLPETVKRRWKSRRVGGDSDLRDVHSPTPGDDGPTANLEGTRSPEERVEYVLRRSGSEGGMSRAGAESQATARAKRSLMIEDRTEAATARREALLTNVTEKAKFRNARATAVAEQKQAEREEAQVAARELLDERLSAAHERRKSMDLEKSERAGAAFDKVASLLVAAVSPTKATGAPERPRQDEGFVAGRASRAATLLQSWWRGVAAGKRNVGETAARVSMLLGPVRSQRGNFEQVASALQHPELVERVAELLGVLGTHPKNRKCCEVAGGCQMARTLLSAYVLAEPEGSSNEGAAGPPAPGGVRRAASSLVASFDAVVFNDGASASRARGVRTFAHAWAVFQRLFNRWKDTDRDVLVAELVGTARGLALSNYTMALGGSEPPSTDVIDIKRRTAAEIVRLRSRVAKVKGSAGLAEFDEAIASCRREARGIIREFNRRQREAPSQVHARDVQGNQGERGASAPIQENSESPTAAQRAGEGRTESDVLKAITPNERIVHGMLLGGKDAGGGDDVDEDKDAAREVEAVARDLAEANNGAFDSTKKYYGYDVRMPANAPFEARVREMMGIAMCNAMLAQAAGAQPQGGAQQPIMLAGALREIATTLANVQTEASRIVGGNGVASANEGNLSSSAIAHAIAEVDRTSGCDANALQSAFSSLVALLTSLEAPVRAKGSARGAAAIERALAEAGPGTPFAMVAAARFLQRRAALMKADLAQTGLMNARLLLRGGRGVAYEREALLRRTLGVEQVQEVLDVDRVQAADLRRCMPVTTSCLREAAIVTSSEAGTALDAVLSEMVMCLIGKSDAVLPASQCPETLLLDLDALRGAQNEMQRLCAASAAFISIAHFPERRHILQGPDGESRKDVVVHAIYEALGAEQVSLSSVGAAVGRALVAAGGAQADAEAIVSSALGGVANPDNPVMGLMTKHMRRAVYLLLVSKLRSKQGWRFRHAVDREFEDLQRKVREARVPPVMQRGARLQVNPEAMAPPRGGTGGSSPGSEADWASPHAWKECLAKVGLRDVTKIHTVVEAFADALSDVLALNLGVCESIYARLLRDDGT